ncbi:complex I subunit 5 family protein [Microvirga guangxiensis]|uniref:Formate hydrogenlyase subunit 3/Multisubunit Na+/H+ antiporter, MnhD subunit n=1 Tax=Microvirga guangxiensis TaxID=549386 RepID=A0A1G5KBT4_9HYPH|nr:complex I subunit 5 family protein [Microvirga guangxiensis]SCY98072.1 Formate hydrogenlyase subunit 3/Multisubunit Na+/H+ antiporter, MnhD subunit [Microvirga guangxiensis]
MTADLALLLPLAAVWPLVLAVFCLVPAWGSRMIALLPLAPVPALCAAILAPRDQVVRTPGILLDGGLALSDTGAVFLGGAAVLWICAGAYAVRSMGSDSRPAAFALFWNVVLVGNLGVFIAADIVSFYVFFALVSLMAYPLVIHDRKPASLRAGTAYVVLAVIGETALLAAFMLASHGAGGSLWIGDVRAGFGLPGSSPAILWLLILGFGIKAGLMPLHVWLPVAHPAAPVPASAVLSGAIVKAGIFGLLTFLPFGVSAPVEGTTLALLGFGGLFGGALLGLAQPGGKAVLAYSTVSQMGLVMGALGAALAAGVPAAVVLPAVALYALSHGLAKGGLFLSYGLAPWCAKGWRWGLLALVLVLALSIAGLPFTAGALAKSAIKGPAGPFGATLIGLSALTSALVLARFLALLPAARAGNDRPPLLLALPVLALASAALVLPMVLHPTVAGKTPFAATTLLGLLESTWPLALAGLLVIGAVALGLKPPSLPEGDLLDPMRRSAAAAHTAFQAAVRAGSASMRSSPERSGTAWRDNLAKVEVTVRDRTSLAVFLLVVMGALLAAFLG